MVMENKTISNSGNQSADMHRGLNYPPINELEKIAGCRFALVSAVAKRARQSIDDSQPKTKGPDDNSKSVISDNVALDKSARSFYEGKFSIMSGTILDSNK